MATRNLYLTYKRDNKHLLYWLIHVSNNIIRSLPTTDDEAQSTLNTTGQITVSDLLTMAKLIAKASVPIPTFVYRLMRSVIDARSEVSAIFQQMTLMNRDEEIEKSNASHKHYIDTLTKAFEILGGEAWISSVQTTPDDTDDIEAVIFENKFSTLDLNVSKQEGEDTGDISDEESDRESQTVAPQRRQQRRGKGKKGKRGKRAKKKQTSIPAKEQSLDDVPLESYRIVEDESGIVTDYLLAVYSIVQECAHLRSYVQGLWKDVAYDGLNSAVAGVVSNMAIAMVKRTESTIFVDFPGHDSYETITKTITRGNPEKAQGMFRVALHLMRPNSDQLEPVRETHIDVKEHFLIHAHQDLLDFITDFQKTRSGKPTKPMLAEIGHWGPNFNLGQATKEERIKWRRSYTINWLYDLVNVFSSIVVQRNTLRGEHHVYERVDWSTAGPWNEHRRLFGLNEFAGAITALAMQKPGTDIRQKIRPHHVFQLQCIVDSLTVSRGWSLDALKGHVLHPPPKDFRPRRDVDLFLDRENKRMGHGYLDAVHILKGLFEQDALAHGNPDRHIHCEVLEILQEDFRDWLGESKYMYGLNTIPPSRFSNSNANGLWEYSPFLCGVGLAESLELVYRMNMAIWDRVPEPMLLIHLHNMLVQKGYITKPIGLYASLEDFFPTAFFTNGKVPSSDFDKALSERIEETRVRRAMLQRRAVIRKARSAPDIHGILNLDMNRFFKAKSNLLLYREADWDFERVSETDLNPLSMLGMLRIASTKQVVDPDTGERQLEGTDLVQCARAKGIEESTLLGMAMVVKQIHENEADMPSEAQLGTIIPPGYSSSRASELNKRAARAGSHTSDDPKTRRSRLSQLDILTFIKWDVFRDITGSLPLSGVNYVWITIVFMILFSRIEEELRRVRNPLWVHVYDSNDTYDDNQNWKHERRVRLVAMALMEGDEECLRIMAQQFQNPRAGLINHIYWEDLDLDMDTLKKPKGDEEAKCVLM